MQSSPRAEVDVSVPPSTSDRAARPSSQPAEEATPPRASSKGKEDAWRPRNDETTQPAGGSVPEEQPSLQSAGEHELQDQLVRVMADFDNLRKRLGRETELARATERDTVATDFLPVLDSLERALDHADADPSVIREGIQAIRDQAVQILVKLGFARWDPLGEQFDPARHEAVASVNDPGAEPGTIVHVVHPGYGDGEHQLRPAAVVVATKGR